MPLPLDDPKWNSRFGGYRTPYNPSSALKALLEKRDIKNAYSELWQELHHQGDVADASYAAVPWLTRVVEIQSTIDWNPYALVSTIEVARLNNNPPVPDWLQEEYLSSLRWRAMRSEIWP